MSSPYTLEVFYNKVLGDFFSIILVLIVIVMISYFIETNTDKVKETLQCVCKIPPDMP